MALVADHVQRVQSSLQSHASLQTKTWFDAYLKGAIEFRGLKAPEVRKVLHATMSRAGTWPGAHVCREVGYELMRQRMSEDKQAGVLLLAERVVPKLEPQQLPWAQELEAIAEVFQQGHVNDWSTCDQLCMKVLGPLVLRQEGHAEREACACAIMEWRTRTHVWHKRASMVSFVSIARMEEDKVFPGIGRLILDTCAHNVPCQERFIQTAVGWTMRELGKRDRAGLLAFCDTHARQGHFTREGLSYATEKLPEATRKTFTNLLSAAKKSAPSAGQAAAGAAEGAGAPASAAARRRLKKQAAAGAEEGDQPSGAHEGTDAKGKAAARRAAKQPAADDNADAADAPAAAAPAAASAASDGPRSQQGRAQRKRGSYTVERPQEQTVGKHSSMTTRIKRTRKPA